MASPDDSVDDDLLSRVAEGDGPALAEAFQQHRPRLRQMVVMRLDRRLQGRVDPSDILQEAFIDISRRAAESAARPEMSFFLWLRMMTMQKVLELHRRHLGTQQRDAAREVSLFQGPMPEVSSEMLASQLLGHFSSASHVAIRAEEQAKLEGILNGLEPIDREILTLRHFEELNNTEVAHVLGLSKSAASNRYIRALKRVKDQWTGSLGGPP